MLPCIAGIVLLAGVARADPASDAEALISRGLELREKKKDDEALALFRQAQKTAPSPRARAQVALAEQALGMWVPAESDLTAALATESDPWISKNRAALDGALGVIRKHIGSLEVRGAEKAEVFVDGHRIGTGAGPYRVEAGRRTLEIRQPGFQATSRTVELPAGGTALLATGGAALLVRKGYVDDYNASSCPGVGVVAQSVDCQDQIDSSKTWQTISIISLIAGGASVIGGGVILLTAPKSSSTVACGPFGCAGTF